jgi:Na+/H+ antiporter NhaC
MEYALAAPLAAFFAKFAGTTMAILVGILGFLMVTYLLLAITGEGKLPEPGKYVKYLILIGIILAIGAYISSGGAVIFPGISLKPITELPSIAGLSSSDIAIIVLVVLTLVIIIWLVKGEGKEEVKTEYVGIPIRG